MVRLIRESKIRDTMYKINEIAGDRVESIADKLGLLEGRDSLDDLSDEELQVIYDKLKKHYEEEDRLYGDDAEIPYEFYDIFNLK